MSYFMTYSKLRFFGIDYCALDSVELVLANKEILLFPQTLLWHSTDELLKQKWNVDQHTFLMHIFIK